MDEADSLSDLHLRVRDRLHDEAYQTIKMWSKETYHKNTFGGIKECKEAEDAFKKVTNLFFSFLDQMFFAGTKTLGQVVQQGG